MEGGAKVFWLQRRQMGLELGLRGSSGRVRSQLEQARYQKTPLVSTPTTVQ